MIFKISTYIAAITTIATFIFKTYKLVQNLVNKFEDFEKNLNQNTLSTLRLTIINEKMPLSERLNAGKLYVDMGGNGEIHALYDLLCEEYKEKMKKE